MRRLLSNYFEGFYYIINLLVGFGHACAPVRCAHPSFLAPIGALRAPPPIASSLLPKNIKIHYFQKQNASLLARTRAARGVYLYTRLSCTLLSYIASYWATRHPTELCCTQLSYAAFNWAMTHPIWATLHPKSYCAPSKLSCTLLSYAAPFWAMLHPSELCCTLLSYAAPFWGMLKLNCTLSEQRCPLRATLYPPDNLHPPELCCTLLNYAAPYWSTPHPKWLRGPPIASTLILSTKYTEKPPMFFLVNFNPLK
jgi:hypothetical protein